MPTSPRKILAALATLAIAATFSLQAAAYHHPLSGYEVRDAYSLGSDSDRVAGFLSHYTQTFSPAKADGPYVSQIQVFTPYAQTVLNSRLRGTSYSTLQAEADYRKAGDTVQIHIQILYPLTQPLPYPGLPPTACAGAQHMNDPLACFSDFTFRFTQGKPLYPAKTYGTAAYSPSDGSNFDGGELWFTFPAEEVASAPLRVTVTNSRGQRASTTFDLASLI